MKRFIVTVMITLCASMLCAGVDAVRKTVDNFYVAAGRMDIEAAAKYYHPQYVGHTSDGKKLDRKSVDKAIKAEKQLKKLLRNDSTLQDIAEFMAITRGTSLSQAEKDNISAIQNTEMGKQQAAMVRMQLQAAYSAQQAKCQNAFKNRKITGCKVNGNRAQVSVQCISPSSGKLENIKIELVKVNGKWLIIKSTATL